MQQYEDQSVNYYNLPKKVRNDTKKRITNIRTERQQGYNR